MNGLQVRIAKFKPEEPPEIDRTEQVETGWGVVYPSGFINYQTEWEEGAFRCRRTTIIERIPE